MSKFTLTSDMLRNHRLSTESFAEYKERRALVNKYLRVKLKKGNMIHNSSVNGMFKNSG